MYLTQEFNPQTGKWTRVAATGNAVRAYQAVIKLRQTAKPGVHHRILVPGKQKGRWFLEWTSEYENACV